MIEARPGAGSGRRIGTRDDRRDLVGGRVVVFVPRQEQGKAPRLIGRAGQNPRDEIREPGIPGRNVTAATVVVQWPDRSSKEVMLVDYKVRVLGGESGTATKVRVLLESADATGRWGTVGVSANILEASYQALVDAIRYKLFKDKRAAAGVRATPEESAPSAAPGAAASVAVNDARRKKLASAS